MGRESENSLRYSRTADFYNRQKRVDIVGPGRSEEFSVARQGTERSAEKSGIEEVDWHTKREEVGGNSN